MQSNDPPEEISKNDSTCVDTTPAGSEGKASAVTQCQCGTPIFRIWEKYEDVAIHFNDLLIKLRVQALAGVAAITAVSTEVLKENHDSSKWLILGFVFLGVGALWTAVFLLDRCYYYRLLRGAVQALKDVEARSVTNRHVQAIDLSTKIEMSVIGHYRDIRFPIGAMAFYGIVGFVLLFSAAFCFLVYCFARGIIHMTITL